MQGFVQGPVQGMDGAVPFSDRMHDAFAKADLDCRFRSHLPVPPHLGHNAEIVDGKELSLAVHGRL